MFLHWPTNTDSNQKIIMNESLERYLTTCEHEAAHAIMRWLLGLEITELTCGENGGNCAGTGKMISARDSMLVTLAGPAHEVQYDVSKIDYLDESESNPFSGDLRDCRELLRHKRDGLILDLYRLVDGELKTDFTEKEIFEYWFKKTADRLRDYGPIVEAVGMGLVEGEGYLSADSVSEIISECAEEHERATNTTQGFKPFRSTVKA